MQRNWLDDTIAAATEEAARGLSRRRLLRKVCDVAFKGGLVLALGGTTARKAWAQNCGCTPPGTRWCSGCPSSPGCPSGMTPCLKVNGVMQAEDCVYQGGAWTENCGDGTCVTCYDCWPGSGSAWNSSCGCRSAPYSCGGGGGGGKGDPCDGWDICGKCKCI